MIPSYVMDCLPALSLSWSLSIDFVLVALSILASPVRFGYLFTINDWYEGLSLYLLRYLLDLLYHATKSCRISSSCKSSEKPTNQYIRRPPI